MSDVCIDFIIFAVINAITFIFSKLNKQLIIIIKIIENFSFEKYFFNK
jgi:hypothetical protein